MSSPEAGVRAPRQQRSRDSLERVLAAGVDVLANDGWEGFTIAAVAETAGVSVGMIYGRFENKDALFEAINDRFMSEVEALVVGGFEEPGWNDLPTEQVIRKAVDVVAASFSFNADMLRVSMLRSAVDDRVRSRGHRAIADLSRRFETSLLDRRADFSHPEPRIAVEVCFRMVFATLSRRTMFGPTFESSVELAWDRLVHELGSACVALVLYTPAAED
jgi:AcrR family transcriptional regulator